MATTTDIPLPKTKREVIDRAVIRFAGDSGDGMQVTGSQFTNTVALYGNDIATFPDSLPKFAPLPVPSPVSAATSSIFHRTKSSLPATRWTSSSP